MAYALPMSVLADAPADVRRFTVWEFFAMQEAGVFGPDERVELLEGVVVKKPPASPEHDDVIEWLTMRLVPLAAAAGLSVRVQSTLVLEPQDSVPMPDLLILPPRPRGRYPTTGAIAVESSVSSLRIDVRTKARIYARAEIPEYWVVDVNGRRVLQHLEPGADGYGVVRTLGEHDELVPAAVALPPFAVRALLDD